MFFSFPSLQNFFTVNTILSCLGIFQYTVSCYYETNYTINMLLTLGAFISRNYLLMNLIEYGTKNKKDISKYYTPRKRPVEDYKYEFHANLITTTSIECITHIFIKNVIIKVRQHDTTNLYYDFYSFVPLSFLFEIIFDLFHYISHRILHSKHFYKYCHKKHHKFSHPSIITTFYQDPLDIFMSNSIPTIVTLVCLPNISYFQFHLISIYKSFIEISGHCGKWSNPTGCFPQLMWFPKMLHIELYTEDHDRHHTENNCNYAKRFSLWDKAFGTYIPSNFEK